MGSLLQNTVFGRTKNAFVSTWRTSNTSSGSSTSTQIKLPLVSSGSYNFTVDWGDGTSNLITVWNQAQATHTYATSGDYIIKISGTCFGWSFNNTGDRLKILLVTSWGILKFAYSAGAFFGCSNLNLTAVTDLPDLIGGNLTSTFNGCAALTTINKLDQWNISQVNTLTNTFAFCSSFNQNIGAWNTSNVLSMSNTFNSCTLFNNGGSNTINNWNTGLVTTMSDLFTNCVNFNQPVGNWNTANVTIMTNTFFNAQLFNQNLGLWNVTKVTSFTGMFRQAHEFNNAGSNNINNWVINTSAPVTMDGMFRSNAFNQPLNLWNTSRVTTTNGMFATASSFNQNIGSWVMNNNTNMNSMFLSALVFNNGGSSTINNWIISNVTSLQSTFQGAMAFNQNIGLWDVSNVTLFTSMFQSASVFNNGGSNTINNWITTSATNMANMFTSAIAFNQPLGNWSTGLVTTFNSMFNGASAFNQNIGTWNTGSAVTLSSMFSHATVFNNGGSNTINNWSTSNVTNMGSTFDSAKAFNQPLENWDTSKVISMGNMFSGTLVFNQDIGPWNVSACSSFAATFSNAVAFNNGGNSSINNWVIKTTGTVSMLAMFRSCPFNQPIGNWNTSAVTSMESMFFSNSAFNQNIGTWNVSNVTNFINFMSGKKSANYSAANLDAIYSDTIGWASRPVKPNIIINFNTIKYTAAGSVGKAILTGAPNNWVITDGGIF